MSGLTQLIKNFRFVLAVDCLIANLIFYFCCKDLQATKLIAITHGHVALSLLWLIYSFTFRLYYSTYVRNINYTIKFTTTTIILSIFSYVLLLNYLQTPAINVYLFLGYSLPIISVWRIAYSELLNSYFFTKRIVILGLTEVAKDFISSVHKLNISDDKHKNVSGYKIQLIIDKDIKSECYKNIKVRSELHLLTKITKKLKIDAVVIGTSKIQNLNSSSYNTLTKLRSSGVNVETMINLYEKINKRIPVEHTEEDYYLNYEFLQPIIGSSHRLKRISDIIFSMLGCIALAVSIPFVLILNLLGNKGPLFYRQQRIGKNGKVFTIIKFRSMRVGTEKNGAVWANSNDSRATKVGKFLRKTRIDEIPQFINLLRGDMSLVGPRPERPIFVEKLNKSIPFYDLRHRVKPGITGWAQVMYKYGASQEDALVKLEYDLYYIKNQSFILDAGIILRTIRVVLSMKGN